MIAAVAVIAVAALTASPASATRSPLSASAGGRHSSGLRGPSGARLPFGGSERSVCGEPVSGSGQCLIRVLLPAGAAPDATITTPTGLAPSTIRNVYGYTASSTAGAGQTIALVDAYNDPDAVSDLNEFSAQYALPSECTSGSSPPSCFEFDQVNQTGGSSLPVTNSSWDLEISLDIEWAHALAPGASILLVEAASNSLSNLLTAEQYAADHANYVSNSWGSSEFSDEASDDSYFTRSGVSFFAAAGDTGGSLLWPSASPDVISVGGTSLTLTSAGTLAQEAAWSDGGGGCSSYETANVYQSTGSVNCAGMRATPDLALDADPNSGISVYDSVSYEHQSGWWTVGGTSASTAMVTAEAALTSAKVNAKYVYASPASIPFRDVLTGSNAYPTLPGYDLATGLGAWSYTPGAANGLTATSAPGGVMLSWSTPSGAPASNYTIWRSTASGEETTATATVNAPTTTYTDTSAAVGVTSYYEVQAANSFGVGPFSDEAQAAPGKASQTITFTAPASGTVGGQATLSATGGESGNPVVFTVDATSGTGVCNVSGTNGTTLSYTAAGSCLIDANQVGNANYTAAAQAQQTITVGQASAVGLVPSARLSAGQSITSPNGEYRLAMQGDGNLVEYTAAGSVVWATGTNPSGSDVVMQGDGNLVVYNGSAVALWASSTSGNPGAYLVLGDDGDLVVDSASGEPLWARS